MKHYHFCSRPGLERCGLDCRVNQKKENGNFTVHPDGQAKHFCYYDSETTFLSVRKSTQELYTELVPL